MKMHYLLHLQARVSANGRSHNCSNGHTALAPGPAYLVVGRLNASIVVFITLRRAW